MKRQRAVLQTISKLGFILLMLMLNAKLCGTGKNNTQSKPSSNSNENLKDFSETRTKSLSNPTNENRMQQSNIKADSEGEEEDEGQNEKEINRDDTPDEDNDTLNTIDNEKYKKRKEGKKKAKDEKIKSDVQNIIESHIDEKEQIRKKIENLNEAIEICNNHRWVFFKIGEQYLRIRWHNKLRFYLNRAGLSPIEIGQIQCKEDIEEHKKAAKKEFEKKIEEIETFN